MEAEKRFISRRAFSGSRLGAPAQGRRTMLPEREQMERRSSLGNGEVRIIANGFLGTHPRFI
jgi:hypothetical protein